MKKFLLHICCAPCAAHIISELQERGFKVTAFFYNPNIYPEKEYQIRKNEIQEYCTENKIEFIEIKDNHQNWLQKIKGLKDEPEGGARCEKCYQLRLEKTAQCAQQNNFQYFDSTLSISPHKNYEKIKKIGDKMAEKYLPRLDDQVKAGKLKFYGQNWKKQDGYKKSCELSHQHNFYRQNYCGCEFSAKK